MLTKLELAWRIQGYANKHQIEFSMSERSTKRWFVYGFDVSACSLSPNGCMETTWIFIQPPDTIYRSWHWNICGEVRSPMVKERNFANYICRMFDKYGSLCNCATDEDIFIVDNEQTVWEME